RRRRGSSRSTPRTPTPTSGRRSARPRTTASSRSSSSRRNGSSPCPTGPIRDRSARPPGSRKRRPEEARGRNAGGLASAARPPRASPGTPGTRRFGAMSAVIPQISVGLSIASILLLVALGLAIIYGTMGVINLAHGEFVMLGAYALWFLQTYLHIGLVPG